MKRASIIGLAGRNSIIKSTSAARSMSREEVFSRQVGKPEIVFGALVSANA